VGYKRGRKVNGLKPVLEELKLKLKKTFTASFATTDWIGEAKGAGKYKTNVRSMVRW